MHEFVIIREDDGWFTVAIVDNRDNAVLCHFCKCGTMKKAQTIKMALEIKCKMGFCDMSDLGLGVVKLKGMK